MTKEVVIFGAKSHDGQDFEILEGGYESTISTEVVRKNFSNFIDGLRDILPELDLGKLPYQLDELSVAVGINGKGKVGFLGTGAEAGGSATLTLKLKRK